MRLDRVFIDGFKNLRNVEVNFDRTRLTTVVIGQNGAGKSNLIEAITDIFRFADMNRGEPRFRYEVDYRIGNHAMRLSNIAGRPAIIADSKPITRAAFERNKSDLFPDLVFGYYSGGSRRLEKLFDSHQRRYYDAIKVNDDPNECAEALVQRRLFYCRAIHGVFALIAFFAFPDRDVETLLREKLGITGFHSTLALFKEPWFAKGGRAAKRTNSSDFWGARGPAGSCANSIRDVAFHPLGLVGNAIDDYRDKQEMETQYACFVRNTLAVGRLGEFYGNDQRLFAALDPASLFEKTQIVESAS
jgi:hypothetical protein